VGESGVRLSEEPEEERVAVDDSSVAPWEPGGSEYVVRLLGDIDDRWVETFIHTRRRSARFSRFHLNRAKSRVTFVCRASDDEAELTMVVGNLKLLIEQTNGRLSAESTSPARFRPHRESEDDTIVARRPRAGESEEPARPEATAAPSADAAPRPGPSAGTDASSDSEQGSGKPAVAAAAEYEARAAGYIGEPTRDEDVEADAAAKEPAATAASPSSLMEAIQLSMRLLAGVPTDRERMARLADWMGTATLVIEDGGSEAEALASLISTSAGTAIIDAAQQEIRDRFGDRVANLVRACHEGEESLKPGGDPRLYSLYLRHTSASIRRILCAGLLRGARALLATYQRLDVAKRLSFRDEHQGDLAYYRSIVEAVLEAGYSSHLVDHLDGVVLEMELAAGPASAERRQKRPLDRLTDELVERVDLLEPQPAEPKT
jgi:hypothetical protein